ncbi:Factor for inversion stimulation Fis, transcriptional activator [Methylomicrobium album BG8]|uniref:Putative Fis-like DNA-binding protein n=1 Tax=Methylomicrobium album BG8 TaxID=686340 RepID=H8GJW3_METAL|nr:Factor for inversion stimulation Fis, transcriptional activator [Methylomicrobium album BG8]
METSDNSPTDRFDRGPSGQLEKRETHLDPNATHSIPLSAHVKQAIDLYFAQMKDHDVANLYAIVMNEIEKPLLESALRHCGYNQTKAAKALGLSRSTLRKKLEQYGLS